MVIKDFSKKYVAFLDRAKIFILILWVLLIIAAVPGVLTLFDHLGMEYNAPEGTEAANARELYEQEFAKEEYENSVVILQRDGGGGILTPEAANFTMRLILTMTNNSAFEGHLYQDSFAGYFLLLGTAIDQQEPGIKYQFVNVPKNDTMFISVKVNYSNEGDALVTEFRDILSDITPDGYSSYLVSGEAIGKDVTNIVIRDIGRIDALAVPLIFLVLFILFRNIKLVPLPLIAIGIVILFGMALMSVIARFTPVLTFVPTIMSCLGLGVGVDYSLFMLSRFQEERRKGRTPYEATEVMMSRAGFTIIASGLTLGTAFMGLVFFPMSLISSIGLSIALIVALTLLNNLIFMPAVTLLIGGWLCKDGKDDHVDLIMKRIKGKKSDEAEKDRKAGKAEDADDGRPSGAKPSFWRRLGGFSSRYAIAIIIITFLLAIPVSLQLMNLTVTDNRDDLLPYDTPSNIAYQEMKDQFGVTMLNPFNIVVKTPQAGGIWTQDFYNRSVLFITKLQADQEVRAESVNTMMCLKGQFVPYLFITMALQASQMNETQQYYFLMSLDPNMSRPFATYLHMFQMYVSSDQDSIKINLFLSVDPLSQDAKDWLKTARSDYVEDSYGDTAEVGFACSTAESMDIVDNAFEIFPFMIIAVLVVIYIIIGLMFKSLIVPLRLLITVGLTISFIFGMFDLIFVRHWGAVIIPQIENINGIFWILPILAFCIVVGLGLDYDLFILSRVKEAVWEGRTTKEGIQDSLEVTGKVVTGAGAIMIVSFAGMMTSTMVPIMEIGFIMAFAILIDATVVRILLVPALMSVVDRWNWWPSKPPVKAAAGAGAASKPGAGASNTPAEDEEAAEKAVKGKKKTKTGKNAKKN